MTTYSSLNGTIDSTLYGINDLGNNWLGLLLAVGITALVTGIRGLVRVSRVIGVIVAAAFFGRIRRGAFIRGIYLFFLGYSVRLSVDWLCDFFLRLILRRLRVARAGRWAWRWGLDNWCCLGLLAVDLGLRLLNGLCWDDGGLMKS